MSFFGFVISFKMTVFVSSHPFIGQFCSFQRRQQKNEL